jgi:hypothetical protein
MEVSRGGLQIAVAEQKLNAAQIGARIEKMRGEGVTQNVWAKCLGDA